jgi:hypothetical protein
MNETTARGLAASAIILLIWGMVLATDASAGDPDGGGVDYYSQLSCEQLWYERNAIFARHGYCFEKPRAIATFGRGCKPPYGKLPSNMSAVVRDIRGWEKRRGCR